MPNELSPIKKDVTSEIYTCEHECQICYRKHYHQRRKFFTIGCGAPYRCGWCPVCRNNIRMKQMLINQGRYIPEWLRKYPTMNNLPRKLREGMR
jgi:hypothetical protein